MYKSLEYVITRECFIIIYCLIRKWKSLTRSNLIDSECCNTERKYYPRIIDYIKNDEKNLKSKKEKSKQDREINLRNIWKIVYQIYRFQPKSNPTQRFLKHWYR